MKKGNNNNNSNTKQRRHLLSLVLVLAIRLVHIWIAPIRVQEVLLAPHVQSQTISSSEDDDENDHDVVEARAQVVPPCTVLSNDKIYSKEKSNQGNVAIVLEQYKLVFLTTPKTGSTLWKHLFRRMMGYANWKYQGQGIPQIKSANGLKYLNDYNLTRATEIMTTTSKDDSNWTRAIFVRDPLERFVSAYLHATMPAVINGSRSRKLPLSGVCGHDVVQKHGFNNNKKSSPQKFLQLMQDCDNNHWRPQHKRAEEKYWPYITFVGRVENMAADGERLLRSLGDDDSVWEDFGATGWGDDGNNNTNNNNNNSQSSSSMFATSKGEGGIGRKHATGANGKVRQYVDEQLCRDLLEFYHQDYANPVLNFTTPVCSDFGTRAITSP